LTNITIAIGKNKNEMNWLNSSFTWSELVDQFRNVRKTDETMAQYDDMSNHEQDQIKNGRAFIGARFKDGDCRRRLKENIESRTLITLDIDFATINTLADISKVLDGKAYIIYSTHSHRVDKPRYRLIIPMDKEMTPDEYSAIARKIASLIGMSVFDKTTFDISRLFYFPSCSADAIPCLYESKGTFTCINSILNMYDDWRDPTKWDRHPNEQKKLSKSFAKGKKEDPRTKSGIIGAFCRVYTITDAIAEFMPDIYFPTDVSNRWTYHKSNSVAGLVTYEDDIFAHSFHASDPLSGKTENAFDLIRIHKFGHLDKDCKADEETKNLPSHKSMVKFAYEDEKAKKFLESDLDNFDITNEEQIELPTFPITVFPEWVQNYCKDLAHTEQVPIDMVAMMLLTAFSCACMKKVTIQVTKSWKQDLNLYILTLAPSGSNKSGVVSKLRKPIIEYEESFNEFKKTCLDAKVNEWEVNEMKLKEVKKKLAKPDIEADDRQHYTAQMELISRELKGLKPSELRLLCEDATVEKIAHLMHHNDGKIAIIEPEGHGFFQKLQGQYSNSSNFDIILKSDEDDAFRVDRISNEREDFKIYKPRITIGLACQPSVVQNLKSELHGTGLFARFLISNSVHKFKPRKLNNDELNPILQKSYSRAIKELLSLDDEKELSFTDDAYAIFDIIYNEIQKELFHGDLTDENGKSFGGKFAGRIARIIALIHVMEFTGHDKVPTEINSELVKRCKPLIDYFISHKVAFHAIIAETEEEKVYKDVLKKIADFANGQKVVNGSEFYKRRMRRHYKSHQYKELLKTMESEQLIRLHHQPNKIYEIEISKKGSETYL